MLQGDGACHGVDPCTSRSRDGSVRPGLGQARCGGRRAGPPQGISARAVRKLQKELCMLGAMVCGAKDESRGISARPRLGTTV